MKIWRNTTTLDGYIPEIAFTEDKAFAEVALVGGKRIDLAEFPALRGIFKTGVGRDNVPEQEASERGIFCEYPSPTTAKIIYEETASFACSLILRCLLADVGEFSTWKKLDRGALTSKTLLVIGMGNIGTRAAEKMRVFLPVSTFDITSNSLEELEPLIRSADCVSLHIPLIDSTRHFFDSEKLSWMKDGSSLINTARGSIVEEGALYKELLANRLRAAFDVFWTEPYHGKLLEISSERFIRTPHVASTCREFLVATAKDFRSFVRRLEEM